MHMVTEILSVEGMTCGHCKMAVESALSSLSGVTGADVDLEGNTVTVAYDEAKVSKDILKAAVEEAGYTLVA